MPESLTDRAGLFTKQQTPIPLAGVSVDAEILSLCARVVITQRYVNTESTPIEAVYLFPLDEGAAVCGFEAIVDGTLVIGEVQEREEAFRRYDDAIERGDGAFLLDEERPDVFQASVGNLPPGKEVLLKITYVTELAVEGRGLRFTLPTTVSPRYAPAEDRTGVGRPDSETLNPPVAWRVPYGLDLCVQLTMPGAIARVGSASHPVSVTLSGETATVKLSQREAPLDRDFVLEVEAAGLDRPRAWIERTDDGSEAVAVGFVPEFESATSPCEVIFVIDRSGSMAGPSIREVRNALQLCLRSMIPGCAFNILGFGTRHENLFKRSMAYDESSLAKASEHIASLEADLGGTEILPALKAALEQPAHASLPRQVVVLTDGEVSNTDAVISLAHEHAAHARIFTFGIGAAASHHLVRGLARAGGGVAEFIHPGERIEPKVVRQFGRLLSPSLVNVRMDWGGLEVAQAPSAIPPIFAGGRLLLYGFAKQSTGSPAQCARLIADSPSGPIAFEVPIDSANGVAGTTVSTLAARARIRELEESPAWTSTRGSRQSARKADAAVQEIVALSMRYGLVSRETSFVAIERRETPVEGNIQLRRVPIALSAGWGGLAEYDVPSLIARRRVLRVTGQGMSDDMTECVSSLPAVLEGDLLRRSFSFARGGGSGGGLRDMIRRVQGLHDGAPPAPREENRREREDPVRQMVQAVVKLQHADGSWDPSQALADAIGREPDVMFALRVPPGLSDDFSKVWATALALACLEQRAGNLEHEWRMVARKGRAWLEHALAHLALGERWLDEAARVIRS